MLRKIVFTAMSFLLLTVGQAYGQTVTAEPVPLDSLPEWDVEDEIDNYDFLYTSNGDDLNYDELMTENLIDEAISHLGARYIYGSKGPNTFDCSGFTSYVYKRQNNVYIGASSREQYARNIPVKRGDLKSGDLVFFTSPRSGRNVGHVGIVVDVDPITDTFTFIHASTKEGVKISRSNESYYQRRYVGARRVLQ